MMIKMPPKKWHRTQEFVEMFRGIGLLKIERFQKNEHCEKLKDFIYNFNQIFTSFQSIHEMDEEEISHIKRHVPILYGKPNKKYMAELYEWDGESRHPSDKLYDIYNKMQK